MKVEIIHLYSDLLNLYGEYGNVSILEQRLRGCGLEVNVRRHRAGEPVILDGADFVYCGSGTEKKFFRALDDIVKYKDLFAGYIENGGCGLFTGNASEFCGKSVTDCDKSKHEALSIFDFETELLSGTRFTGDVICTTELFPQSVIGFINKSSNSTSCEKKLLTVTQQFCNLFIPDEDGAYRNNFFCTHLIGPLLVKNPPFLSFFARKICDTHGIPCDDNDGEAEKAYENSLAELLGTHNF